MKNIINIYSFSVCLITTVIGIVTSSVVVYALFAIAKPEIAMDTYTYRCYIDNTSYQNCLDQDKRYDRTTDRYIHTTKRENYIQSSDEEKSQKRQEDFQVEMDLDIRESVNLLITNGIVLSISMIIFFLHWRLSRKYRQEKSEEL